MKVDVHDKLTADCRVDGYLYFSGGDPALEIDSLVGSGHIYCANTVFTPTAENRFDGIISGTLALASSGGGSLVVSDPNCFTNITSLTAGSALRFASGVTNAVIKTLVLNEDETMTLENEDAGALELAASVTFSDGSAFGGAGSVSFLNEQTIVGSLLANTGAVRSTAGAKLTFGDGTTDADLSTVSEIESAASILTFNNTAALDLAATVSGGGSLYAKGEDLRIRNYAKSTGAILAWSDLTIDRSTGWTSGFGFENAGTDTFTFKSGRLAAAKSKCPYAETDMPYPAPIGFYCNSSYGYGTLRVEGGEIYADGYYHDTSSKGAFLGVELLGGRAYFVRNSFQASPVATAADPMTVLLDGGTFIADLRETPYGWNFGATATDKVALAVGAKGGLVASAHGSGDSANVTIDVPVIAGAATPGTLRFDAGHDYGYQNWRFTTYPFALTSPVAFRDGRFLQYPAVIAATPDFYGTGDIRLESTYFLYDGQTTSATLRLANAPGGKVTLSGSSMIKLRTASDKANQSVEIGPSGAAKDASLVRERGAALFLCDNNAALDGSASTVKVGGGVSTNAAGVVRQPVFTADSLNYDFVKYDDAKGFVTLPESEFATTLEGCTVDTYVRRTDTSYYLPANQTKQIGGLKTCNWGGFTIQSGARLIVGNGTDPASVIVNYCSGLYGPGTLDFGTSEGVIAIGAELSSFNGHTISCVIDGSSGVSYVSAPLFSRIAQLTAANVYTGPTHVSGPTLCVKNAGAFSSGDVYVHGGYRNSGRIAFEANDMTFANNFHVEGDGALSREWNYGWKGYGALAFIASNTVLNGSVELVAPTRISAKSAGNSGTINGVVSGDRLSVYGSAGTLTLMNHNTYTGGTDIALGSLSIARGDGVGTGDVLLHGSGVLRFVNTEAITFTNTVEGIGSVVFAGTAPVTLAGASFANLPFKTFGAGTVLDFADAANNVYVPYVSGDMDLGGQTLTVGGLTGSGTVVNGTLTVTGDIRPGGANAVGTLTLDCAVAFAAGAKLVVEDDGAAMDRLVLSGAADISNLALDYRVLGRRRSYLTTVVLSAASVSGKFSSVTKSGRGAGHAEVVYAPASASIESNLRGVSLVIR